MPLFIATFVKNTVNAYFSYFSHFNCKKTCPGYEFLVVFGQVGFETVKVRGGRGLIGMVCGAERGGLEAYGCGAGAGKISQIHAGAGPKISTREGL